MEKLSLGRGETPVTPNDMAGFSVRCPSCDHANPAGSHFCNRCGMPVHFEACGRCEAINPRGAASCHKCGCVLPGSAIPESAEAAPAIVETPSPQAASRLDSNGDLPPDVAGRCAASAARRNASRVDCTRPCLGGCSNIHRDGASSVISSSGRRHCTARERRRRSARTDFRATAAAGRGAAVGACRRAARSACGDIRSDCCRVASRRHTPFRDSPRLQELERRSISCRCACAREERASLDNEVERIAVEARHLFPQASNTQACDQVTLTCWSRAARRLSETIQQTWPRAIHPGIRLVDISLFLIA